MLNLIVVVDRYATERTNSFISVWFWASDDPAVPADVKAGGGSVDTDNWGTPSATFPSTTCDIEEHFATHNIIIKLAFCGDGSGQASIYASSGCPSTCNDFVNTNPAAFGDAFFEFNAINVFFGGVWGIIDKVDNNLFPMEKNPATFEGKTSTGAPGHYL
ncbi:hypothetical protein B0H14DRAFT_2608620 [Mycena olivaceomarginata]|nr:hypothetical protein B0H14DRAFT_2608620 [Mycena olivaceomarginata]